MKRFASLASTAALAGALIGTGSAAHATFTYNMVSVSDLNANYLPGDTVQFVVTVTTTNSTLTTLTPNTAIAFDPTVVDEFGNNIIRPESGVSKADSTQTFPGKPGTPFFNGPEVTASSTTTKAGSPTLDTFQFDPSHVALKQGTTTLTIPAGTYTIGTFNVPISETTTATSTTIILPTAFGYAGNATAIDLVAAKAGATNINEPLVFGTASLTYKIGAGAVTPAPSSLLIVAMGAIPAVGVLRRRRSAK